MDIAPTLVELNNLVLIGGEGDGFFDVVFTANPTQNAGHAEPTTGVRHHFLFRLINIPGKVVDTAAHIQ